VSTLVRFVLQTKLAPLGALSLIWNILLAPKFHGEEITRRNVMATVVIFLGVTSTVMFSTHDTPTYDLPAIIRLFKQPSFILYTLVTIGVLSGFFMVARLIERKQLPWHLLHVVCYGGLAGIFGGQSVMLAKTVVELVKSAIFEGSDAFTHVVTYVMVAAMAVRWRTRCWEASAPRAAWAPPACLVIVHPADVWLLVVFAFVFGCFGCFADVLVFSNHHIECRPAQVRRPARGSNVPSLLDHLLCVRGAFSSLVACPSRMS